MSNGNSSKKVLHYFLIYSHSRVVFNRLSFDLVFLILLLLSSIDDVLNGSIFYKRWQTLNLRQLRCQSIKTKSASDCNVVFLLSFTNFSKKARLVSIDKKLSSLDSSAIGSECFQFHRNIYIPFVYCYQSTFLLLLEHYSTRASLTHVTFPNIFLGCYMNLIDASNCKLTSSFQFLNVFFLQMLNKHYFKYA